VQRLLKAIGRALLILIVAVAVVYACEDLLLRYRVNRHPDAAVFDQVLIYPEGEVKGGKLEYYMDQAQPQTCVHAMFPHFGDTPCWYLSRHTMRRIAAAPSREIQGASRTNIIWRIDPLLCEPADPGKVCVAWEHAPPGQEWVIARRAASSKPQRHSG
jgi:hypothetical protein